MANVQNMDATYFTQGAVKGFVTRIGKLAYLQPAIPSVKSATKGDIIKVTVTSAVSSSVDFSNATGYTTATEDFAGKDLTVNIHKYRNIQLTDADWASMSGNQAALEAAGQIQGEALAYDFISASFASVINNTNFAVSSSYKTNEFSSSTAWIDATYQADTKHWRDDRYAVCGPLLWKSLNIARAAQSSTTFGTQQNDDVFGFIPDKVTMALPVGDGGFICSPNAFTIATVYHKPQEATLKVMGTAIEVTDPTGKITLGFKEIPDAGKAQVNRVLEVLGGAMVVDPTALVHIKN